MFRFFRDKKIKLYKYAKIKNKGTINVSKKLEVGYIWNKIDYGFTSLVLREGSVFSTDNFVMISGSRIKLKSNAKLTIKSGYMNSNSNIVCDKEISIGDDVTIASGVVIRDSDSHQLNGNEYTLPIHIGDHVWIGTNAIILKGVTIGNNVVIGAGSVVTKDIPDNCMAAGVPAKVIKKNIEWK